MRKVAGHTGIVGSLNPLDISVEGDLGHQGYPSLADSLIENRLVEICNYDRPKSLIWCLGVPVKLDQRCTEHSIGSPDHGLKKRSFILEMVQHHTFGHTSDLAYFLKRGAAEPKEHYRLERCL
jgi:hypothetical protein